MWQHFGIESNIHLAWLSYVRTFVLCPYAQYYLIVAAAIIFSVFVTVQTYSYH